MIKNYLKTAWRNLIKSKMFSVVNITGLAIGMAITLLISLWIGDEISFNRNFKNYDRIAWVMQNTTNGGEVRTANTTPYPLAEVLRKEYGSHFKQVVVAMGAWEHALTADSKKLFHNGAFFEPGIGEMLSLDMVAGSRNGLNDMSAIMLSETLAKALFGTPNAIGRTLTLDSQSILKVTGVYKDIAPNSEFGNIEFMATWKLFFNTFDWVKTITDPWRPNAFTTYVQLADNADINEVSKLIRDIRLKHVN